jgi:Cof subfamily protein (haloacid dehalogenase superfamily)
MPVQLVAIDLDGTLLKHDLTAHPSIAPALARVKEYGVEVAIATGRAFHSASHIVSSINHEGPMVCTNGSHVVSRDGRTLTSTTLNPDLLTVLLRYAFKHQVHVSAYTLEGVIIPERSSFGDQYRQLVQPYVPRTGNHREVQNQDVLKIVFIDEATEIPRHRERISHEIREFSCSITESAPQYLEILPANTNKGIGLQKLAEHLGISRENVAAIGDYLNDVEMLQWAGIPVAIGNALPEVKALSKFVVGTNEEGGVAQFLEEIVLQTLKG